MKLTTLITTFALVAGIAACKKKEEAAKSDQPTTEAKTTESKTEAKAPAKKGR